MNDPEAAGRPAMPETDADRYGRMAISAGTVVNITSSEYADFHLEGTFVAIADVTPEVLWSVLCDMRAGILSGETRDFTDRTVDPEDGRDVANAVRDELVPALVRHGPLVDVAACELHKGAYGEFDVLDGFRVNPESFMKMPSGRESQ